MVTVQDQISQTLMPKHKSTSTATGFVSSATKATTRRAKHSDVKFPELSTKEGLECRVLLEDQILLIDVRTVVGGERGMRSPELQLFRTYYPPMNANDSLNSSTSSHWSSHRRRKEGKQSG